MPGLSLYACILVASGGAAGSVLRYLISLGGIALFGTGFPWGTLAVNLLGSGAIGALAASEVVGPPRHLLVAGFLGGFTTFSAFSLEATLLWERAPALAMVYVALSVGLGLVACVAGFWLFRR